ncbi:MAG: GNAT family N-acetyltransferase [Bacteroidales bacterium]|nr:GNAT family N-acetyltransferase [Bacteroidales bacterium]MCF8455157.1 GNAT family N-acetyltransferase [Bacteroidales bacterium]
MPETNVTIHYLEMTSQSQFRPKTGFETTIQVQEIENDSFMHFMLFTGVGLPWKWYSRLSWSIGEWEDYFRNHTCKTFLGFQEKKLVGYFELEFQEVGNVEINFFGFFPQYIGCGLGGHFLSHAIDTAWKSGAKRIFLHTCNIDHKYATANYTARGFSPYKEETVIEQIPSRQEFLELIKDFFAGYMDRS